MAIHRVWGAEDPTVEAAIEAMGNGLPAQSVQLLQSLPDHGRVGIARLTLARAYLALGRGEDSLQALGAASGMNWIADWPVLHRGTAEQCAGEALILTGDDRRARLCLDQACRQSGSVAVDRCLALLSELCRKTGDPKAATDYARVLWEEWPRSSYRGHGGVLLAELIAAQHPDEARAILAGVRLIDTLAEADRLRAAELLCSLLLDKRPGACLVVAEQEARRLPSPGQLPLYRALAMCALDPQEGLRTLQALSGDLRTTPTAQAALERLRAAPVHQADVGMIIERAHAEAELGRADRARTLLLPLATDQPAALIALSDVPGTDMGAFIDSPAARNPMAALALGRALVVADRAADGWTLLRRILSAYDAGQAAGLPLADLLTWAGRAAEAVDPQAAAALRQRLLSLDQPGQATGQAWCDEAERRSREGGDAEAAWERAAHLLPQDHPWAAAAAWRAARNLVDQGIRLADARRLVEVPAWAGSDVDQLRCRFLVAQIAERTGDRHEAQRAANSLLPLADATQLPRLQQFIARLLPGN